jgi:hypothetical protein
MEAVGLRPITERKLREILDAHYYIICRLYRGNRSLALKRGVYEKTEKALHDLFLAEFDAQYFEHGGN